jgi:hypothetical protein
MSPVVASHVPETEPLTSFLIDGLVKRPFLRHGERSNLMHCNDLISLDCFVSVFPAKAMLITFCESSSFSKEK